MIEPTTCNKFQEDLPLLFSGQLGMEERLQMQKHLETCPECRSLFRSEAALMSIATADTDQELLGDHPDSQTLDNYVHSRSSLSPSETTEIERHIESCAWCRDLVTRLQLLPQELSDLVSEEDTPFINNLVSSPVVDISDARKARSGAAASWRWIGAVAAAAVIVLVGVLLVTDQYPGGPLQSRVEMEFVDSGQAVHLQELRRSSDDKPTVGEVNGWISIEIGFDAYPDEESYRVVIENTDGEVVEKTVTADDFSGPGRLTMRVKTAELSPGEYRLKLYVSTVDLQTPPATLTFPFVLDRK